jgi:PAS domain S-box-containing protein
MDELRQLREENQRLRTKLAELQGAGQGPVLNGTATEHRRVEEELQKFVSLADHSTEFIGMCDMNLKPFYVNAAGMKLVGLDSLAQACSVPVHEFFFPEDQAMITEEFYPKVLREGRAEVEVRFRHFKTGAALWMIHNVFYIKDAAGRPIGLATVSRDITKRKQAETQRDRVFEYSLDMLCVVGFDGYFKRVSPSFERTLGWSEAELLSKPFSEFIHPDDREATLQAAKANERGKETIRFENRYPCKDGSCKWISWNAHPVVEEKLIVAMARDITDAKRAEEALRGSEHRLAAALEIAQLGVWEYRPDSGRIEYDQRTSEMFGTGEIRPMSIEEFLAFVHEEDRQRVAADVRAALDPAGDGLYDTVYRIVRGGDGAQRWIAARGHAIFTGEGPNRRLVRAIGTGMDITERKQAEEALRKTQEQYRGVVENTTAIILRLDTRGVVTFANSRALEFFGYTAEELIGKHAVGMIVPAKETTGRDLAAMIDAISADPDRFHANANENMCKDGRRVWLDWTNSGIYDEHGKLTEFLAVGIDATERKKAQEALRASEAVYRSLFENMLDGFARCQMQYDEQGRPVDFTYLQVNGAFERLTGLKDVVGKKVSEVIPGIRTADPELFDLYARVASTGQPERREFLLESWGVWFSLSAYCPERGQFVAVFDNITARKTAESRMEADLDALTRMHVLSGKLLKAGERRALLQEVTDAAVAIMGSERGTLQLLEGDSLRIVAHHGHQPPFLEYFAAAESRASACGEALKRGGRVIVPDVEESPLFVGTPSLPVLRAAGVRSVQSSPLISRTGALLGVLTTHWGVPHTPDEHNLWRLDLLLRQASDLIESAKAEEALRESEARFRTMANAMPQLAWVANADGWIPWYNRRWYEYTGTTPEQMEGWGWQSVHDPVALPKVLEQWKASIATGEAFEMTFPLRGADGVYRLFLTRGFPLKDAAGHVMQWFGTNTDVTELKRVEEALQAAKVAAESANKAKDEFLAVLSHELRTPLTSMLGWVRILENRSIDESTRLKGAQVIERSVNAQRRLVEDLLDISMIITGKMSINKAPLDFAALVRSVVDGFRPAAEAKQVELHLVGPASAPAGRDAGPTVLVDGDSARLEQVVWNLVSNAVKFTPAKGRVDVALATDEDRAVLSVTDTGKGIRAEFLPRVFDRFAQEDMGTTRRYGGLGLGLAIVKHLVDRHGGTISAGSEGDGKGAQFTVTLPRTVTQLLKAQKGGRHSTTRKLEGMRVLVVEDDADVCEVLALALTSEGADVVTASSAESALLEVKRFKPQVLVSDLGLPDSDGYVLMREIRELEKQSGAARVPAIALTGYAAYEHTQRTRAAGFDAHMAKPVEPEDLIERVRQMAEDGGEG